MTTLADAPTVSGTQFHTILGIRFFVGDLPELLALSREGGLIVVPAAPALAELPHDHEYRAALKGSTFAITDSAFMVLLWALLRGESLQRISGLRYLRALLEDDDFRQPGESFWIMPGETDSVANRDWLAADAKMHVLAEDCYIAPNYPKKGPLTDERLLATLEIKRPKYIVINIGGGTQEKLGHYLFENLGYRPTIICTGAAIAFLSGRQVNIPTWADRLFLGWLMRCLSRPTVYVPRYWRALRLAALIVRHGRNSPTPERDYVPAIEPSRESEPAGSTASRSNR